MTYHPRMAADQPAEYDLAEAAARRLEEAGFGGAAAVVQTGSGLAPPALESRRTLDWSEIPGFPRPTAPGHRGAVHHGLCRGVPVLVLEGRLHLYEGRAPAEVVRPLRAVALAGVRRAILTNASGGVRPDLRAGAFVRITDHLNLQRADPLAGPHDPRFGDRFVVLAGRSYDPGLAAHADAAARALGLVLHEGVYAAVAGPTFETPAEVRMLRALGADIVGMSTVPEVIAAAQLGVRVLALSFVANPAGVVLSGVPAEREVLDVAAAMGAGLTKIVEGVIERIGAEAR